MVVTDIGILGPLRITFANDEHVLSGAKLRGILVILAYRAGDEVGRDELTEELDLARTTNNAVNALHAHVVRLRRWLHLHGAGRGLLETVNSGYRLNLDRSGVDAHCFTDLVQRALNLAPGTPLVVATILEEALALWRGDALQETLDGALATAAADYLHQLRAAAREMLIDAWVSLGHNQKVALNARKFMADDPLNESIRTRHVVALRRMGRYAEAIESYQTAERTLRQELGVRPGRELQAAAADIAHPPAQLTATR